jgi:penicillin-binding protein 1A
MMQDVVQHGTGIEVAAVGKPLAGKTGTTNDWNDAWFVGFSPKLVAGVFVGFDQPRTLGDGETGGNVAAPIFRDFMAAALANTPAMPFPTPAAAEMVRVGDVSGQPASAGGGDTVIEAFRPGTAPSQTGASAPPADDDQGYGASEASYDGGGVPPPGTVVPPPPDGNPTGGTGGLY